MQPYGALNYITKIILMLCANWRWHWDVGVSSKDSENILLYPFYWLVCKIKSYLGKCAISWISIIYISVLLHFKYACKVMMHVYVKKHRVQVHCDVHSHYLFTKKETIEMGLQQKHVHPRSAMTPTWMPLHTKCSILCFKCRQLWSILRREPKRFHMWILSWEGSIWRTLHFALL